MFSSDHTSPRLMLLSTESMKALGVRESVLTAKHGCGFCAWPTTAKLPMVDHTVTK